LKAADVLGVSICGTHLGQRSYVTAPTGRTYDRKQPLNLCDPLQPGGRPHMDARNTCGHDEDGMRHLIASGLVGEPTAPVIGIAGATNRNS